MLSYIYTHDFHKNKCILKCVFLWFHHILVTRHALYRWTFWKKWCKINNILAACLNINQCQWSESSLIWHSLRQKRFALRSPLAMKKHRVYFVSISLNEYFLFLFYVLLNYKLNVLFYIFGKLHWLGKYLLFEQF